MPDLQNLWHPDTPGFDCLWPQRGHIWVSRTAVLAQASWCLWCETAVTNEHEPEAISEWREIYGPNWEPARCDSPPCRLCFPEMTEKKGD